MSAIKKKINELLNHEHWHALANDKLVLHHLLVGLGLPSPELYAVYHPIGRYSGPAPSLSSPQSVAGFIRTGMTFPFLAKPVWGAFGRGVSGVLSYDRIADRLELVGGERLRVGDYVARLTAPPYGNHLLFQEYLRTDESIELPCAKRLSTVRLIVLLEKTGPKVLSATWRLPVGLNVTDNFAHGRTGNLLGSVDLGSGRVDAVVQGLGKGRRLISTHPITQEPLVGLPLPGWNRLLEISLAASSSLPGLRIQHWDIALSDRGPVVLEVNALGDMDLRQLAGR